MIAFERPAFLLCLLLVPAFWFLARRFRARRGLGLSLGADGGRLFAGASLPLRLFHQARQVALILAYAVLVLAAAGPLRLSRQVLYLGRGNEVIIVLDVSPSMAAADFEPSRLDIAKRIIEDFLASRRNETVGLVAFGGEAALVAPPTLDYGSLRARLSTLEPGMFGEGTAIGAGLATAIAHGSQSGAPERHLVLLTDGEGNAGPLAPREAASLAARNGFILTVIGVGSRGEVPLTYRDPATGSRRSGTYLSSFDREVLESLAAAGGGSYFDAENPEALERAFDILSERSVSLTRSRSVASEESASPQLLLLALFLAFLARLLGLVAGSGLP